MPSTPVMLRYLQISALLCPACQRMLGEVSCNHQDAPSAFLGGRRWRTADALILSKRSLVRKLGRHSGSRGRGSRSAPLSVHTHTHTHRYRTHSSLLTLHFRPSTVSSSKLSPILKLISVVRTVVEVLM